MSRTFRQTTALAVILAMAMPQIGLTETSDADAAKAENLIRPLKKKLDQDEAARPPEEPAAEDGAEDGAETEIDSMEEAPEERPADEAANTPAADDAPDAAEAETPDPETAGEAEAASPDEDAGKAVAIPSDAAVDEDATDADTAEDDSDGAARPDGAHEDVEDTESATPESATAEDADTEDSAAETDASIDATAEDGDVELTAEPAEDADTAPDTMADEHAGADDATEAESDAPEESNAEEDTTEAASDSEVEDAEATAPESREDALDEAAEQAAEGSTSAEAEALDAADDADDGADEEGERQTVTEADARSSAEDFATSIAEAVKPAESRSKDSDLGRDIAKGLLGGLAAYAVGQALTGGGQVALNSGDRVVVTRSDGSQQVLKDDNALLFRPGAEVTTRNYDDGSTRVVVHRENGSSVITIRDADMRVLRRTLIRPDGTSVALIDETVATEPVTVADLPPAAKPNRLVSLEDEDALRMALLSEGEISRGYSLSQIRNIPGVRALVAPIDIEAITFNTGSAAINPDQARQLGALGRVIAEQVRDNPNEVFMIEGYTDTTGTDAINLALSDRRAESLALALTEYFDVPPENMVVQGFGKRFLKVPVEGDVRENRRVSVRRITDLLARN